MKYNENQKIITKVKGLLDVAKDNNQDEEAQTAFLLAQKLMVKYDINESSLQDQERAVEYGLLKKCKKLSVLKQSLALVIANNFKVLFVRTRLLDPKGYFKYSFYGYSSDVELAKNMYFLAIDVIKYRTEQHLNDFYLGAKTSRNRKLTMAVKKNYIYGFIRGLEIRLNYQTKKYDLMVKPDKEIYKRLGVTRSKYNRVNCNPSSESFKEGFTDGYNTDLAQKTISVY